MSGTICAKHPKGQFLANGTGHLFPARSLAVTVVGFSVKGNAELSFKAKILEANYFNAKARRSLSQKLSQRDQ